MGSGFSKMKKQAKLMQNQFSEMRRQMQEQEFTGNAGNGLVSIALSGEKELKKISIKPECVNPNDIEGLQDLILAAFQDAASKIESSQSGSMPSMPWQ